MAANKQLTEFRAEMKADLTEIKTDLRHHIARTEALERFQAKWSGAFIALTALATLAGIGASAVKIWSFFQ